MKLQQFHLEFFEQAGATRQATLDELRREALAEQQQPSDADAESWPGGRGCCVLARDDNDRALGFGILAESGRIACVTVRAAWRRRGVGTAILHELITRARTSGQQEVSLDAPDAALEFFRCAGFTELDAAEHRTGQLHQMRLPILRQSTAAPSPRETGQLPAAGRGQLAAARQQLLEDARHQLLAYLPELATDVFGTAAELDQLRRIACSGRAASIRVLLHDPAAAVANDHPLLPLAQRLSSAFQIRTPTETSDLAYASAYLLNDAGGYLFLPDAARQTGRAARTDRGAQAPLQQHFNEVWERAERATILNALYL